MRGNQDVKYVWMLKYAKSDLVKREKSGFLKKSNAVLPTFLYLLFLGFHPAVLGRVTFCLILSHGNIKTYLLAKTCLAFTKSLQASYDCAGGRWSVSSAEPSF